MMNAPSDLAVVVSHYNHHNFATPVRNLRRFCRHIEQMGLPIFGMELLPPGHTGDTVSLHTPGTWTVVRGDNRTHLWQKEAMWNATAAALPPQFKKVLCCDGDLWFDNPAMPQLVSEALERSKVVVPFTQAKWTDERGKLWRERPTSLAAFRATGKYQEGHPGFAVALQREFWDKQVGFYPFCPTGRGDGAFWQGLLTTARTQEIKRGCGLTPQSLERYERWAAKALAWGAESFEEVPGNVWHEHHGTFENRNYLDRHNYITTMLPEHVTMRVDGLVTWSSVAPIEMMHNVYKFFAERKEDA